MGNDKHASPKPATDEFNRGEPGGDWGIITGQVGVVAGAGLGILSADGPMKGLGIVEWRGGTFAPDQFSEAVLSPRIDPRSLIQVFVGRRETDGRRWGFHWNTAEDGRWELKRDGIPTGIVLATRPAKRPSAGDTIRIEIAGKLVDAVFTLFLDRSGNLCVGEVFIFVLCE